jgi:hypothetical protein
MLVVNWGILLDYSCKGKNPNLNSALCFFLRVRIHFWVGADGGTSHLEQVPDSWPQDPCLRAIMWQFCDCQPTFGADVLHNAVAGCLVKHLAIHACDIINSCNSGFMWSVSLSLVVPKKSSTGRDIKFPWAYVDPLAAKTGTRPW